MSTRRLIMAICAIATLLFSPTLALAQPTSNVTVAPGEGEIVCWGDSMTEGIGASPAVIQTDTISYDASYKSYPEILQDLCGVTTYNFGVGGATSSELVAMQSGELPDEDFYGYDDSLAELLELGQEHTGDILILEIGSNGGWDNNYTTLISQYRSMIRASDCKGYLVIGDTDDPGTSMGDRNQDPLKKGQGLQDTAWEAALRRSFGDRFINMRTYLIKRGLKVCGIRRSGQDKACASFGMVPHALRADWTHLNSYGYFAQAFGIYKRGVKLGFWNKML
ncbi:MAG: SGNH/GDSL hydrolase family protein [Atopobiaceae bacterium]|nr:SGNH/GDSL hydrolase family protein [Atopobiaceae bacterium]